VREADGRGGDRLARIARPGGDLGGQRARPGLGLREVDVVELSVDAQRPDHPDVAVGLIGRRPGRGSFPPGAARRGQDVLRRRARHLALQGVGGMAERRRAPVLRAPVPDGVDPLGELPQGGADRGQQLGRRRALVGQPGVEHLLEGGRRLAQLRQRDHARAALERVEGAAQHGHARGVGRLGGQGRNGVAGIAQHLARLVEEDGEQFGLLVVGRSSGVGVGRFAGAGRGRRCSGRHAGGPVGRSVRRQRSQLAGRRVEGEGAPRQLRLVAEHVDQQAQRVEVAAQGVDVLRPDVVLRGVGRQQAPDVLAHAPRGLRAVDEAEHRQRRVELVQLRHDGVQRRAGLRTAIEAVEPAPDAVEPLAQFGKRRPAHRGEEREEREVVGNRCRTVRDRCRQVLDQRARDALDRVQAGIGGGRVAGRGGIGTVDPGPGGGFQGGGDARRVRPQDQRQHADGLVQRPQGGLPRGGVAGAFAARGLPQGRPDAVERDAQLVEHPAERLASGRVRVGATGGVETPGGIVGRGRHGR
jgi:hypothetical protein